MATGYTTSEDSPSRMQQAIGQTAVALHNGLVDMRRTLDRDLDLARVELERDIDDRDSQLRGALLDLLTGSIRDRQIGAALLAGGIVLAASGSVVGALA